MMREARKLPRDDSNWAYEIKWDGVRAVCLRGRSNNADEPEPARRDVAVPRAARSGARSDHARLSSTARSSRSTKRATELRHPPAPDARGLGEHGPPSDEDDSGRLSDLRRALPGRPLDDGPSVRRAQEAARRASSWKGRTGEHPPITWATADDGGSEQRAGPRGRHRQAARKPLRARPAKRCMVEGEEPSQPGCRRRRLAAGPGAARDRIGSLAVGYYEGRACYAGQVGTGFKEGDLVRLAELLTPLRRKASPFSGSRQPPKGVVFAEPNLVVEVEFANWTRTNTLVRAAFKGLRDDKDPQDVVLERA